MPKSRGTVKPWERQLNESAQAFEAFYLYLSMGTDRSYRLVAEQLKKSHTIIGRWGREWNWQRRIREYDNHLVAEDVKRAKKEVQDRYSRFGRVSDQLTMTALEVIRAVNLKDLSPQDALAFLRVAATLADKNKGVFLPTEADEAEGNELLSGLLSALLSEEDDDD